ncbi:homoserine dehydrogenase [Alkalihalobacillus sp. BA299]|uniref:homoserine dehydrogenase n=1 Tax=Alkalihalobacillus sp. BA299 TaxID=2815938 RepID=UPI001AD95ED1|nr:homoserine dehydrogenase [Alkalihalobacillus sp. BA299]
MLKIGIIGFGTVGSGVYERILSSQKELETALKKEILVKKVLVKDHGKDRENSSVTPYITSDAAEFFALQYDVVFEAIGGIEPAKGYITNLIKAGTSVITANKELIAKHGEELEALANKHGVYLGFEAAVGGGIPIVNSFKTLFTTTPIHSVTGILNGTTNYILTEMKEKNRHFNDVLAEAKQLGYAEADPTDDIEGYDALYKIRILSRLAFNVWPNEQHFHCNGISNIEDEALEFAEKNGLAIKLIAKTSNEGGTIHGFVSPSFVTQSHPLYNINGVTNGVCIDGKTIDQIMMSGPGAGKHATANSMVEDFVLHEQFQNFARQTIGQSNKELSKGTEVVIFVGEHEEKQVASQLLAITDQIKTEDVLNGKRALIVTLAPGKTLSDLQASIQIQTYPLLGELAINKIALFS